MAEFFEELKQKLSGLEKNISLKEYSTFRIGGLAKYFLIASNEADLKIAIQTALDFKIDFLILGGGSNTLISTKGFDGLIIIYKNSQRPEDFFPVQSNGQYFVEAMADWPLSFLINQTLEAGLSGMEWGIGIPGTVGGAINGNAGAFGKSIGESIEGVQVLEIKNNIFLEKFIGLKDCEFGYRSSIFKKNKNLIILSAKIKLEKKDSQKIKEKITENLAKRKKHPQGFSLGSVFKNYEGLINSEVLKKYPELDSFPEKIIPAGYLIDQCGLRGKEIGGAIISNEHANFILNKNNATSEDVLQLINLAKKEVKKKFKINLEEEIKII
jgi:UDP-N-acetylmuramate dehydrogenase